MEDVNKLMEEFEAKYGPLLTRLGGENKVVFKQLDSLLTGSRYEELEGLFSDRLEEILKGKPVDLVQSLLTSWFGRPHSGIGRAFERNKATLRIIRKLRAEVLPKEVAAKAFQKGTSANNLTEAEKDYLQENLTNMLQDLGHIIESVVRTHAVSTNNASGVAAAEAELHDLMDRLAEAQRQEAKHEKVLPDPATAPLPEMNMGALSKVLKEDLPEAPDAEIASFSGSIAHNYSVVLDAMRKNASQNGGGEDLSAEEIPHAALHMARRVVSVNGTEKYDTFENLEDTIAAYDKQVNKILDNAKKARAFFGKDGVLLRALENFHRWLRKEYGRKQHGGIAAGLTDEELRKHLLPVEKMITRGDLTGKPKELEDELNKISSSLGVQPHYVLPDHLWDIVEGKKYENDAWIQDIRDLHIEGDFLWTIDPKEPLEKQWFMGTDEDIERHKKSLSTVLAALEWVHAKLEGDPTLSTHLHTLLVHALSSGSYVGKEDSILEELKSLGLTTRARASFADRARTQAKSDNANTTGAGKTGVLPFVEKLLADAMRTLWVPKGQAVENVGHLATLVRNKAQELRRLREEELAVLPEGYAGSLLMPKGKFLTHAHKKAIADSMVNAMEKKREVRANPFPEAIAKDYVKSLLANLEKRKSVPREERQPDYAELLTYGEGFWEGLRNFVSTFDTRFKEYRLRMARVLSQNAHEAVDTEPVVKQGIAQYTDAVVGYAQSLSKGAALMGGSKEDKDLVGQAVVDRIRTAVASHIKGMLSPDAELVAKNYITRDPVAQPLREALIRAIRNQDEPNGAQKADKAYTSMLASVKSYLERSHNGFDPVTADMLSRSSVRDVLKSMNLDYEPLYARIMSDPRRGGITETTKAEIQRLSSALVSSVRAEQPSGQEVAEALKNLETSVGYNKALADVAEAFKAAPQASSGKLAVVDHAAVYSAAKDKIMKGLDKSKDIDQGDIEAMAEEASGYKSGDRGKHIAIDGSQDGDGAANKGVLESFAKDALDSLFSASRAASAANGGWALPYLLAASNAVQAMGRGNSDGMTTSLVQQAHDRYQRHASMGSFDEHLVTKSQDKIMDTDAFEAFNNAIGSAASDNDIATIRKVVKGVGSYADKAANECGLSPRVTLLILSRTLGTKDPVRLGSERALAKLNSAYNSLQELMQNAQPPKRGAALIDETSPNDFDVAGTLARPLKAYRSLSYPTGDYRTPRALRDAARDSIQYKRLLDTLLGAHERGLGGLNALLRSEYSRESRNVASGIGVSDAVANAVVASLLNADLPQSRAMVRAGNAKKLFLTDEPGSTGSLEPHNYPGVEDGAFNALRRYFRDLKKTHYFEDMLKGKSPVMGTLKTGAGRFRRSEKDIVPGTKLHEEALQNLDNAYQEIVASSLYQMVTALLAQDPGASVSDFFTNVQEWNSLHEGSPITVDSIESFMAAMGRLLQVEKIYDEEASRVKSEFMSGIRGVYRNLGDIEKRRGRNV